MKSSFLQMRSFIIVVFTMIKMAWQAHSLFFVALFVIQILQGLVPLATAWITKAIFDLLAIVLKSGSFTQFPRGLLLLLVVDALLSIISQIVMQLDTYVNAELGRRLTLNVQSQIFEKINSLHGLAPFESPHFHDTIQVAAQRVQYGPTQMLDVLTNIMKSFATLASFLGVLIAFSPLLAGLVVLAAIPQLYIQIKVSGQRFSVAFQNTFKERLAGYYGHTLSNVQFAKEVRLFSLGKYFLKAFRRVTLEVQKVQRNQQLREIRWQSVLSLLSTLVSTGAFVVVVLRAFSGRLSIGDLTLYTSAVGAMQMALYGIALALANAGESILFYRLYTNLLEMHQPISIPSSPHPVSPLVTSIEFRNVSFRYSKEHPWILRNINLSLPVGQCLALIGLNGAGKTTVVKLLTRMYDPSDGQILWDGIDIREFDPADLRLRMGAIFQDFARFDLSVYENIALGDVNRLETNSYQTVEELVRHAANKSGIHKVITGLPQGYQTVLSRWLVEDGSGVDLSGGEWQKIALARMFMRDAEILILDEPTAALDAQTEYDIYSSFVELVAGKTSFLISHRFNTVRMADKIAVLEDGKISEYGSHEELLSLGGTYSKLYNMQANMYK